MKIFQNNKNTAKSKEFLQRFKLPLVMLFQMFMVVVAYTLAFILRFEFEIPQDQKTIIVNTLPFLIVCRMFAYYLYKLNFGWWRFVSMIDLINITKAVALGTSLFMAGLVFAFNLSGYPRSVVVIEAVLTFMLLGGVRFGVRWFREAMSKTRPKQLRYLLIVGAGKAGTRLLNEIRLNSHLGLRVVGFIDDNPMKKNAYIQGVRVLGNRRDIPKLVRRLNIDEVIIALPSVGFKRVASVIRIVKACGVEVKVLPNLLELIRVDGLWGQLQDAPFDELLGRPILKFRRETDLKLLKNEIRDRSVLITGSAGSIGSELARQIAGLNPEVLILYDRNENDCYFLELELKKRFPKCNLIPVIGDVTDKVKLHRTVAQHKIDLIYHTAAYKHVPMMEREPVEAVRNNILSTKIVAEIAARNHVKKCVYISSDKAVNPSSIMGATKRVGELVLKGFSGNGTKFIMVRFGNVIGSNGSVIHLFKKQIEQGGPVTVTHREASRYFMSISEAVQLVMTAGAMGMGGEIFLLDMGQPIKITALAKRMIESSGLKVGKDIEIKYIGLRHGEKLHEELYWKGENIVPTGNKKITMLESNGFSKAVFFAQLKRLESSEKEKNSQTLLENLKDLVPEGTFNANGHNGNGLLKPVLVDKKLKEMPLIEN